ncbi:MAG: TonB-dependent receptor [Asticcacaulis sp.]|uniref:TonB-dependent receptor n=1 Tax=Asticcacaulis sp. TaxID=1872648 RepID=UPI0039E71DF0
MRSRQRVIIHQSASALAIALVACSTGGVAAQTAPASDQTPPQPQATPSSDEQVVVVTSFRRSLTSALAVKRRETGIVDSITAEDIGKFPDSNLAESMQRVPGVAITRGDGGEGKTISVRGLGAQFTRVLLNGMEGASSTGSSDIRSGYVSSRSFDFSAFPSELFSSLKVRKTSEADVEEGSLGATVELETPRPLSYSKDFTAAVSAETTYDDLRKKYSPRFSAVAAGKFLGNRLGLAGSVAWTERHTREEGWSAIDILQGSVNHFCSPEGYTPQSPATSATNGSDAENCSTGNPRLPNTTENVDNYTLVDSANTYVPRTPRLIRSDQDYTRLGATVTLQYRPSEHTDISLDALYSRYDVERQDSSLSALSFSRSASQHGSAETSVVDAEASSDGTLVYGLFNGVDLVSDLTRSKYSTTFSQLNLKIRQDWGKLTLNTYLGASRTVYDKPMRTQISMYANNVDGFSFDFRNNDRFPTLNWGMDVSNPDNYVFGPNSADNTVNGVLAMQVGRDTTDNTNGEIHAAYQLTDWLKLKAGLQYREANYDSVSASRVTQNLAPSLPAGTTMADLTSVLTGFGSSLPVNTISGWAAPDYDKFDSVFGFSSQTGDYALAAATEATLDEKVNGAYAQADFDTSALPVHIRGNIGTRYVHTDQSGTGTYSGTPLALTRSYDDWLPSATIAADLKPNLILRFAAAKVMSRPELSDLLPGTVSIALNTRTVSSGNFMLDPIRAKTADLSLEYYFGKRGLLAGGLFYKDIDTYIQTLQRNIPFSETGLPLSLLEGSSNDADTIFTVSNKTNTPGGTLKGFELNYQQGFDFLPGFWKNTGIVAAYTYTESNIAYCTDAACSTTITAALVNLSKNTLNTTIYYEDDKLSMRLSGSYRDKFLLKVPSGRAGSDVQGNIASFYLDASASYQVTPNLQLRLEAQNLTNQELGYYEDSVRQDSLYSSYSGRKITVGFGYKF